MLVNSETQEDTGDLEKNFGKDDKLFQEKNATDLADPGGLREPRSVKVYQIAIKRPV